MSLDYTPGNYNMFVEITNLWNTVERYDNLNHIDFSKDFVDNYYQYAGVNLIEDVVLVKKKNGRLTAFGTLFINRFDSTVNPRISIMVHPFYRNQGIGRGLLSLILKKAEIAGCKEVSCIIPEFRLYSMKFVEKYGFKKNHSRIKMQNESINKIDLKNEPKNLVLRAIDNKRELDIWTSLQNDIFRDDSSYSEITVDSIRRIVRHRDFSPELAIFGEVENDPIGYCIGWPYKPTTSSSNTILRILALGVLPDFRRMGYGRSLMREVVKRGLNMGYTVSELLVGDSNVPAQQLYRELGFREKYRLLTYRYEF
jgi:ribosomal protein S18 acetylase RimI-like enzyme